MASSGPSKFSTDFIIGPLFEGLGKKLNLPQKSENRRAEDARKKFNKDKKKSKNKNKKSGGLTNTVPPKRGPNPQGLKNGGCPFRENGAKSDIQGIKDIQVKGKKFTGTK